MKTTKTRTTTATLATVATGGTADRAGMVGRSAAARLLGVSVSTLRRRDQELAPIVDESGAHLYEVARLENYRTTIRQTTTTRTSDAHGIDGELAKAAFDAFQAGTNPVDVVCEMAVHPDAVERLHTQWARLGGRVVIERSVADAMRELLGEHVDVKTSDPGDLLGALRRLVDQHHGMLSELDAIRMKERAERARRTAIEADAKDAAKQLSRVK